MSNLSYKDIAFEKRNSSDNLTALYKESSINSEDEKMSKLIEDVQEHIAKDHSELISEIRSGKKNRDVLENIIDEFISTHGSNLGVAEKKNTVTKLVDVMVGWERLQPLIDDETISDIFTNEDLEVIKRVNGKDILTNISFKTDEELEQLVKNLAIRTGEKINRDKCDFDGFDLVTNIRITAAIYGSSVRKGEVVRKPYITLRKYKAKDFKAKDFIENETFNEEILNFYKEYAEDSTFVIVGEPEAGKSTHLDFIQSLKDPMRRTIRIEEEPELKTKYKNSVSFVERKVSGEETRLKYDMAEFAKIATRLSGKDVVIGEVRGKEAWYLFRLLDMGYRASYSIHGDSCEGAIEQTAFLMSLENSNLTYTQLRRKICSSLNFITLLSTRKLLDIAEVVGYDDKLDKPILNYIFQIKIEDGKFYWKKGSVSEEYSEKVKLRKLLKERRV